MNMNNNPVLTVSNNNNDSISNETSSTADKNDFYDINIDNQDNTGLIVNQPNISKLSALIEKEKGVLLTIQNKKEYKKDFEELKNNIQMIQHNLDNFFVYNMIKVSKKKMRKED